jgi:hypothetical protein
MEYLILVGLAVLTITALRFTKEKEAVRVSWNKVAEFIAFMVILSILRVAFYDFMLEMGMISKFPTIPAQIAMSRWTLALVFWEDAMFGLSLYFIHKYMKAGKIMTPLKWILTIAISALFASGHSYQGLFGVAVTSLYPYFISKKYGELHGFGTVMCCHIIYDNFTVYTLVMLPYLLG